MRLHHDDVIKWKHFPRYWPFVRGIHRSPVNSPHKGQWRGALVFSLICTRINGWVNTRGAGDLRRYRAHYDVIVMEAALTPTTIHHHTITGSTHRIQHMLYSVTFNSRLDHPCFSSYTTMDWYRIYFELELESVVTVAMDTANCHWHHDQLIIYSKYVSWVMTW